MKIGINGRFYGAPVSGVQRFAREAVARLSRGSDASVRPGPHALPAPARPTLPAEMVLFLPAGVEPPEDLDERVRVVRGILRGRLWEHLELPWRARAERCGAVLHLANVAPLLRGPHVVVVHDVLALTNPEWFARPFAAWYRFAQGRWARRAARVAAVSGWAREEAERVLGLEPGRTSIVPQGIEPFDRPATAEAVRRARQRWALPDVYLLAVAGGDPRKNVRFLLRMLARWRGMRGVAPPLIVVGGDRPAVHGYASVREPAAGGYGEAEIRAAGDVRFLGRVDDDDLRTLYTAATVFCFPSQAEGFGRPPLEAMGCATPAVVAPYGPAQEVLDGAARIVELETSRWIAAIERLIESPEERRALAETGRRHALRYRWDATVEALLALCREVAPAVEAHAPVPVVPDAVAVTSPAAPESADAPPLSPAREPHRRRKEALPGNGFRRRRSRQDRAAAPEPKSDAHEEPPEEE